MRFRKFYEIEDELKLEISKDINNPKVYELIYELVYRYLQRSKKVGTEEDRIGIATITAEELYMKILNGGEISYWVGYIAKVIICYIKTYRNMTSSEIIQTADNPQMFQGIIKMSTSDHNSILKEKSSEYDMVCDIMFCDSVPNIIKSIFDKCCRYNEDSAKYLELYTAIITSLITNGDVEGFFLSNEDIPYYKFLLCVTKEKLKSEMRVAFETQELFKGVYTQFQVETIGGTI